jgi:hypothetical protein
MRDLRESRGPRVVRKAVLSTRRFASNQNSERKVVVIIRKRGGIGPGSVCLGKRSRFIRPRSHRQGHYGTCGRKRRMGWVA